MKKLLVMLMVIAMASFLFVGCFGTTPDIPDEDEEGPNQTPVITSAAITSGKVGEEYIYNVVATDPDEDTLTYSLTENPLGMTIVATTGVISWTPTDAGMFEVGVKVSDPDELFDVQGFRITVAEADEEPLPTPTPTIAPVITSVPDAADGYVNKAEAADGIVVNGTAPTLSEVKVYINGLTAGTGDVTATGAWTVVVANADLIKAAKTDGAKVLHAKATDIGSPESASSNKVEFTLDTELPTIDKCSAKAGTPAVSQSVVEVSDTSEVIPWYQPDGIFGCLGSPWDYWVINSSLLVEGTWTLTITTIVDLPPFGDPPSVGDIITVTATDPTGAATPFTFPYTGGWAIYQFITGVSCSFDVFSLGDAAHMATVKVTCAAPAVPGYIDVTFNEPVTGASILAGTWTAFGATVNLMPLVTVRSATEARLTETAPTIPNLVAGVAYSVSCSGPTDLAGNPIPAGSPESCMGVVTP